MIRRLSIFCLFACMLITAQTRPILRAQEPTPAAPGMTAGSYALVNNLGSKALLMVSKSVTAYFYRGLVHQSRKEYAEAIADFTRAAELDSTESAYLYARCTAHLGKGDAQAAVDDCTRVITLNPKFATAYNSRGGA